MPCPLHRDSEMDCFQFGVREAACNLCKLFYERGWLNAYGGGVSVRDGNAIYMAPVGLSSEGACPVAVYVMEVGEKLQEIREKNFPFFERWRMMLMPHQILGAGAVIHSHSLNAVVATRAPAEVFHPGSVPGLIGAEELPAIPIIENSLNSEVLEQSMRLALEAKPAAEALLIRGHGLYVWGKNWMEAKQRAERYEEFFKAARKTESK